MNTPELLKNPHLYIFGFLSAIFFGMITSVGKLAMLQLNSQTMIVLRYTMIVLSCLFLILVFNKWRDLKVRKKHIPIMVFAGILLALETLTFWWGIANFNIIPFLAIYWCFPLMNLGMDIVLKEVKISLPAVIVIIVGVIGVYLGSGV